MNDLLATFIFFFTVIDPIGTIPVFIAVTASCNKQEKKKIAMKAALVAFIILLFFMVVGEIILDAINIPLSTFQIAGGIVLFLFALTMIFGESKPEEEVKMISKVSEKAVFPLAIPSIASPGAILAAILLTENHKFSFSEQFQTALMMLCVLLITWLFMALSTKLFRFIGNSGSSIISRIMGLILSAVAVANVLEGVKVYFEI